MKTTIELPEQLMSEVKSLAAREQRRVDDLIADLLRAGIDSRILSDDPAQQQSAEQWLAGWFKLADDLMKDAPPGPTAREILQEDRNRSERR